MPDDPFPRMPNDRLSDGGWLLDERTTETVFSLSAVSVEGHTCLYEQPDIREAIGEQTDGTGDLPWRFFFATRLSFSPPLVPGVGPRSVFPIVHTKARKEFAADLRERGFEEVERKQTQHARTESGDWLRLTKYAARFETGEIDARSEAWFGVWIHQDEFRLAGGAYPVSGFDVLDPPAYREELLALIRAVE